MDNSKLDNLQNYLILLKHHVKDAKEGLAQNKPDIIASSLEDIGSEINKIIEEFLPQEFRANAERIKEQSFKDWLIP